MSADIGFHVITEIVKPIHKSIEKKIDKTNQILECEIIKQ